MSSYYEKLGFSKPRGMGGHISTKHSFTFAAGGRVASVARRTLAGRSVVDDVADSVGTAAARVGALAIDTSLAPWALSVTPAASHCNQTNKLREKDQEKLSGHKS